MALSTITLADIADFRYDGFRNQYSPKLIGYGGNDPETRLVPNTFPYQIKLFEGIQENIPSSTRVKIVSSGFILTEVEKTQTPANNQYRVNYDELGYSVIEFNASQKNIQVEISYYGLGHLIQKSTLLAITKTAFYEIEIDYSISPYTIPDDVIDTSDNILILADCSDGDVQVNFPDVTLNKINISAFQTVKGGRLILAAKTGDKIRGINDYDEVYLDDIGNQAQFYSDSNYWYIKGIKHTIKWFDDFRNCSDWVNINLGSMRIQYDNKSGTFIQGEVIIEAISGYEYILVYDDGTYLYLKNAEENATNNRVLTGQTSGATCDVDEITGTTKNISTYISHYLSKGLDKFKIRFFISLNNSTIYNEFAVNASIYDQPNLHNMSIYQQSVNEINLLCGGSLECISPGFTRSSFTSENYYYTLLLEVLY